MEDVVIIDAARSLVGKKNGSLGGAHPTDVLRWWSRHRHTDRTRLVESLFADEGTN